VNVARKVKRGLWEIYGSVKFEEEEKDRGGKTHTQIDKSKWSGQE
jgi:hypothetical protein